MDYEVAAAKTEGPQAKFQGKAWNPTFTLEFWLIAAASIRLTLEAKRSGQALDVVARAIEGAAQRRRHVTLATGPRLKRPRSGRRFFPGREQPDQHR